MDTMLLRLFQRQVADQCRMTLYGVSLLNDGLQRLDQEPAPAMDTIWIAMQILLTGAGNVAKALWGSGGKHSTEREPLRRSLGVHDSSPLREVSMRNHFEHCDQRLACWWRKSASHIHLDRHLGPPDSVPGLEDKDRFRVFDPATRDVFFWGECFNVSTIATAVEELLPRAEAEARKPHWES
jgi:hypothetical protein